MNGLTDLPLDRAGPSAEQPFVDAADRAQSRDDRVKRIFHTAGGLATMNVLIAVLWQ